MSLPRARLKQETDAVILARASQPTLEHSFVSKEQIADDSDVCLLAASVSQMLCGSLIVFAAILSSVCLKRRLNRWHDAGCAVQTSSRRMVMSMRLLTLLFDVHRHTIRVVASSGPLSA